jgi:hypothetical protein
LVVGGSLQEIVDDHFVRHSSPDHVNRKSLTDTLTLLGGRPAHILETGSSAWGTNSSRLFDSYVRRFGGSLTTIDIRADAAHDLRGDVSPTTEMIVADSVRALQWIAGRPNYPKFDLVYLDSFDLDVGDPIPSMVHGLAEFLRLDPLIKPGTLVLIDDTPVDDAAWRRVAGSDASGVERETGIGPVTSGKGALVVKLLDPTRYTVLHHDYQLLLRRL